ncbi:3,4-dihydroxy-2-butanone 4-phosphate synthase [Actinoplanes couchii]|nr:3,4-dihydroxy-2-butanone 4-phosphate synthase [Actinoplanes couchii]
MREGEQMVTTEIEPIILDSVEQAVADIAAGRPVVVVDDAGRENEGDLVIAAEWVTPEMIAFMMTQCRGLICAPMTSAMLDRLEIGDMVDQNTERHGTAFTVSVDAREGITTGISAIDRSRTIRLLVDNATRPDDLVRPGHVFPLRALAGGVLERPGHTEAAVDLAGLAGLIPAGVICEIADADGSMMRGSRLARFCTDHGLTVISIEDLIEYRRRIVR